MMKKLEEVGSGKKLINLIYQFTFSTYFMMKKLEEVGSDKIFYLLS
jgi:hypothetical protein